MRILDKSKPILHLGGLGMEREAREAYLEIIHSPFGMVVCAGPTGSGKTTTLYATLNELNDTERNIMTIEDPVEYVFPSMNQLQVNERTGFTFETGLRTILRQDPDIILVGEMRDAETARIAVQSAMTGHFVLSSVHATDTISALLRFRDMGVETFLTAASLLAVVSQRLVRRICPSCKSEYVPSDKERRFYEAANGPVKDVFYHGTGCNFCSQTGYQDRTGVFEVLPITPTVRELIVTGASGGEIQSVATREGMKTQTHQAIELVVRDVTTITEVIRSIYAL